MSKYISIGSAAVSIADFQAISNEDKVRILEAMFNGCGLETDNHGQIIQYTELMYGDASRRTVVPLIIDPVDSFDADSDNDAPDPHEDEEEPVSEAYVLDEDLPPTVRPSQIPIAS